MSKEGRVGPAMPGEAQSGGQINQSTPLEQRVPDRTTELSAGPIIGGNGEYKPCRYETETQGHKMIVEQR